MYVSTLTLDYAGGLRSPCNTILGMTLISTSLGTLTCL